VSVMVSKKQHDSTAVILRAWRRGEALETVST
jgi:hypothetical protein